MNEFHSVSLVNFMPRFCPDCGRELTILPRYIVIWLNFRAGIKYTCMYCDCVLYYLGEYFMDRTIQRLLDEEVIRNPDPD